ncbi:MAG TPA: hypothetical protein VF071_02220 [Candidatus Limnocylindria bacterium]
MYRKIGISIAVLTAMALTVSIVAAGNAHFVGTPKITVSGNTVTVSGKVAGLGNIPQIHVEVSGDAQCVNPGKKEPKADNKDEFSADGDFPVQNGKANFSLDLTATFQPDCTPPMTVSWSNISITVTAPDGTFLTYP